MGGFDFVDGQSSSYGTIASGDIFIDTDMDNGYYEYVLDLDFDSMEYSVIQSA